ncbi:hypothetical protein [Actinoallomurus sp. NPDC050550]|uniref:hypothetical protein n=1 Tax=Actinoallomurus sp. NPDC050550 TaxID=3154937 RepID=UPI00340A5872
MMINNGVKRRFFLGVIAFVGWAAIPGMMFLAFVGQSHRLGVTDEFGDPDPGGNGWAWAVATLGMAAVVGGMAAVAVADAVSSVNSSRSERMQAIGYVGSVLLSAFIWLFGGIIAIGAMMVTNDCGAGVASPCLDHPRIILSLLYVVCLILPTPLLAVVCWLAWRSQVCVLLAPPFILDMYLLAIHLHLPHAGFGDTTG